MSKDFRLNIETILESLNICVNRVPATRDQFLIDDILQDATLMRLQEAGEQMVRIRDNSPEYFQNHHTESWYKLIGLRNIIAHGYVKLIWQKCGILSRKISLF